jgi:hypothetical protein
MKNYSGFQVVARAGAGLLLLSTALTAWGVSIILTGDAGGTVSCTTSLVTVTDGNVTAEVPTACIPGDGGGGDPPPPGSFTLSVGKAGTGSGTVTSSPTGINCGADCSQAYTDGTSVSLSAVPATGSSFDSWSGACTGTGTCNLSMTANRSVTATFTADTPPPGQCGTLPPDVDVVNTGSIATHWPQQSSFPFPQDIVAFQFTVPPGFAQRGTFTATKTSASPRSKLVVISTCPGVLAPVGGQSSCVVQNLEASTVYLSANSSSSSYYCKLSPGQTYYANAVSKQAIGDTAYTCSSTTNCSFLGSRSSPF